MKRHRLLTLLVAVCCLAACRSALDDALIPRPLSVEECPGKFRIHGPVSLSVDAPEPVAEALVAYLRTTDIPLREDDPRAAKNYLRLILSDDAALPASDEGYELRIHPAGIQVRAHTETGLFYGLQTLLQLREQFGNRIPAQNIVDAPRYAYRGLHLDVSRHFFDKEFVKKQLRMMSSLKLNRLHWHLTDGAGWRIAIDRYPLLTEQAAWRVGATWQQWQDGGRQYCREDDPRAQGGYYTKDDIREVLACADSLHITVIPEIEMPGHSEEVLAAYPELSCSGDGTGGEYCIGNEATFVFLKNVLTEVIKLFPSQYIHIGGDEASAAAWAECPKCQALMAREGMTDPHELQGYLIRRIARFLHTHGRELIGWDEILQAGLPADVAIMSWRGEDGGREAAASGRKVVMTPNAWCYFDSYQDDPTYEPQAMSGYLPLRKVYAWEPAPGIWGVQANLWAEFIPTPEQAEYMLYPRTFALAELAWSASGNKDYDDFYRRALIRCDRARERGYNAFDLSRERGERPESLEPAKHLAMGCPVSYAASWSANYPAAGAATLTDGLRGSWSYGERWQGFLDSDVDVTIDLGAMTHFEQITADFIQWHSAWIWLPARVEITISDNGVDFHPLCTLENDLSPDELRPCYRAFGWRGGADARYVRYHAISGGRPGGWLFTDEIMIN